MCRRLLNSGFDVSKRRPRVLQEGFALYDIFEHYIIVHIRDSRRRIQGQRRRGSNDDFDLHDRVYDEFLDYFADHTTKIVSISLSLTVSTPSLTIPTKKTEEEDVIHPIFINNDLRSYISCLTFFSSSSATATKDIFHSFPSTSK